MLETTLVVNAGSSTLKLAVIRGDDEQPVAASTIPDWNGTDLAAISALIGDHQIDVVGHRIVHGGDHYRSPVLLDDAEIMTIGSLAPLAPLHQGPALAAIDATGSILAGTPAYACFDTAFHHTLPPAATTYAVPELWRQRWGVRRYGFHGLSHRWAAHRVAALLDHPVESLAAVVCHLGAGASLCAVLNGTSVDTTMGFTPLEGLVMATRSGSVDPGVIVWLQRNGVSLDEISDGLESEGGLLALAGTPDMRVLLTRRAAGDQPASTAFDVYVHRLCREIAAMTAALGRLDALVFTGGVGEHAPEVRAAVATRLSFLGIAIDPTDNEAVDGDALISASDATTETLVVASREDLEIVRQVGELRAGR